MLIAAFALTLLPAAQDAAPVAHPPYSMPGEEPVDPHKIDPANAGAKSFTGTGMARAFGGQAGIKRIVARFAAANFADPRIGEIFTNHDRARFERVVFEQFCFILNAGCSYSGRDMRTAHKNMGIQQGDMNRLVENLQAAMRAEKVPFAAQNRFLSKLAPMRGTVVDR